MGEKSVIQEYNLIYSDKYYSAYNPGQNFGITGERLNRKVKLVLWARSWPVVNGSWQDKKAVISRVQEKSVLD